VQNTQPLPGFFVKSAEIKSLKIRKNNRVVKMSLIKGSPSLQKKIADSEKGHGRTGLTLYFDSKTSLHPHLKKRASIDTLFQS